MDLVKLRRQDKIMNPNSNNDKLQSSNQFHALWHSEEDGGGRAYVSFPCALVSSDPKFHLEELSVFYFVLRPTYDGVGDKSPGQTFFGHYPSGQFRLLRGAASFRANGYQSCSHAMLYSCSCFSDCFLSDAEWIFNFLLVREESP
mmetsp:Transcript_12507/g.20326  ORF Transcript_12507/g.20326 Transcript_12507/m.20326 type:complete len:145 (+) Transcript_12507:321-755(+)